MQKIRRFHILSKSALYYTCLYTVLGLPVCASWWYSENRDICWLAGSLLFVLAVSVAALALCSRIRMFFLRLMAASVLIFPVFVLAFFQFGSFYFQGGTFNDRFFFHLSADNLAAAFQAFPWISAVSAILILSLFASLWMCVSNRLFRALHFCIPMLLLAVAPLLQSPARDLVRYYRENPVFCRDKDDALSSLRFRTLGFNMDALVQEEFHALPGRNLVLIYLESLESLYTDTGLFPGLTPEINRLAGQGLQFTGMVQVPGAGWTLGGMVASQCGTPLLWENDISGGNDIMAGGFLNRAVCLGDILHRAGYFQEYIGGASIKFGGKGVFLRAHGYDEVKGREVLMPGLDNPEYHTGWGLYDDSLFKIAAREYLRLASMHRPFNLTLLTLDTHHPEGNPSASCAPYRYVEGNSILDAVHCTDWLVGKFIREISQYPAFRNTVVVVMSDHLAMRNEAEKFYPEDYDRKPLFFMLHSDRKGGVDIPCTHMDIAPTVLDAMHVKTDAAFFAGRDLLGKSGSETAIDFEKPETARVLRYVNSNLLSASGFDLCKGEYILEYIGEDMIRIGNRPVPLYNRGEPLDPERFAGDMAILAFLGKGGTVDKASVMPYTSLCRIIFQNSSISSFLAVKPGKHGSGLDVLVNLADRGVMDLGHFDSVMDLKLSVDDGNCSKLCRDLDDKADRSSDSLSPTTGFGKVCSGFRREPAVYDPDTGRLTMAGLIAGPDTFARAVLQETRPGFFELSEYSPIVPFLNFREKNVIYPVFKDFTLYIPLIQSGQRTMDNITMKLASRKPFLLKVTGYGRNFFTRVNTH